MAWYYRVEFHFRGRLIQAEARYGRFNGAEILKGRKLKMTPRTKSALVRRAEREFITFVKNLQDEAGDR